MHVAVPLIGAIVFGAALYGSIHPDAAGHPQVDAVRGPASGSWWAPGCCCGCRSQRPDSVAQIGSILGEEGGSDAAILDT